MPDEYDVVLSDPPWSYYGSPTKWGAAAKFYPTVSDEDMVEVARPPLAPRGILFMWATSPRMDFALSLLPQWGLHFRGIAFVWVKTCAKESKVPIGAQGVRPSIVKPTAEFVVAASPVRTGRPMKLHDESIRQVILAPKREHSRKPEAVAEAIEHMYPDARKLEMFARQTSLGWDSHGT